MADSGDTKTNALMKYLNDGGVTELIIKTGGEEKEVKLEDVEWLKEQKHVGVYFSAHWCGPCRQYTPKLAEKYKELNLPIIFNSWDQDAEKFKDYYKTMPWAAIPYKYKDALGESKAFEQPRGIPSLYLFNPDGELYQKSGRGAVMDGRPHPYESLSLDQALGDVIDGEGNKVPFEDLKKLKTLVLYFSAHWCGPCQAFTPKLAETYQKIVQRYKDEGKEQDFEFIFVSSDQDAASFKNYFKKMPWKAINFENATFGAMKEKLNDIIPTRGIPHVGLMQPDGTVINASCRGAAEGDSEGTEFPWLRKPMYDLASGQIDGFTEKPCIILMVQTCEDKDTIVSHMVEHAKAEFAKGSERECLHFSAKESSGIVPKIRQVASELPEQCMMILNIPKDGYCFTDLPTSSEDVTTFWNDFKEGKIELKKFQG